MNTKVCRKCRLEYRPEPYRYARSTHCSAACRRSETPQDKLRQECWLWGGDVNPGGYPIARKGLKTLMMHKVSWERANGPWPEGKVARHSCDTPRCINPDHIQPGTPAENVADMDRRGRRAVMKGEKNGFAKLREPQAREILALRSSGLPPADVAGRYDVSHDTVRQIWNRRGWRHLDAQ